jgi:phosphatidyl-myo-inositol dimannoside synthase
MRTRNRAWTSRRPCHEDNVVRVVIASADYTPDGGGIGAYANGLWRGLSDAGCDSSILCRSTPERKESSAEHMVPVPLGGSPARSLGVLRTWYLALKDEVRRRNCDWTVVPTWDPVGLAATLPVLRRALPCRIAVVFHGADVASAQGRKAQLLRYVIQSADRLIANSSYTRELVGRRFGAASGTVRPGIGEDDLDLPSDIPRSAYNVISVGRLIKRKGHATVMEAVARLAAEYPGLSYTIVGDGPERASLENLSRSLGIADRVHMRGHVSVAEKRRCLLAASVFALPILPDDGDPEGFGIAYLEAGAARLPVVATRTGGVTECVRDGESGLFCEASVPGVTNTVRHLLQNSDLRMQLGEGGRRIAEAATWNSRAGDLLAALEERP